MAKENAEDTIIYGTDDSFCSRVYFPPVSADPTVGMPQCFVGNKFLEEMIDRTEVDNPEWDPETATSRRKLTIQRHDQFLNPKHYETKRYLGMRLEDFPWGTYAGFSRHDPQCGDDDFQAANGVLAQIPKGTSFMEVTMAYMKSTNFSCVLDFHVVQVESRFSRLPVYDVAKALGKHTLALARKDAQTNPVT